MFILDGRQRPNDFVCFQSFSLIYQNSSIYRLNDKKYLLADVGKPERQTTCFPRQLTTIERNHSITGKKLFRSLVLFAMNAFGLKTLKKLPGKKTFFIYLPKGNIIWLIMETVKSSPLYRKRSEFE